MEFLLALLILLLFAKLLGEFLYRHGFSPLIGEVAVGIIFGPALLGWIVLTPGDPTSEAIHGVAMLGLVILMLVAGMNSRFDLLMKVKFHALVIALCGMAVSFVLAFAVPYTWGYPPIASLFVAAALSNTATEVVARVAGGTRLAHLMVGSALIDDILAVYILGILSTSVLGGTLDLSSVFLATAGIVTFFVIIAYLSKELIIKRDVMRRLWRFEHRGIPLAFAIIFALALAVIARHIGLHYIIGAYMAGLFISRLRERPDAMLLSRIRLNTMLDDVTTSLQAILTPLFFVYVGLTFAPDWGQINLIMLGALIAAAFLGKITGCGVGASAVGYKKKDTLAIGVAMCSRGSLELAVIQFGLLSGVLTPELFAMMTVATLSTTILTPILFKTVVKRR